MFEVTLELLVFSDDRSDWRRFTRKIVWPFPWLPRVSYGDNAWEGDVIIPDGEEGDAFTVEFFVFDPQGVVIFRLNEKQPEEDEFDEYIVELKDCGWVES